MTYKEIEALFIQSLLKTDGNAPATPCANCPTLTYLIPIHRYRRTDISKKSYANLLGHLMRGKISEEYMQRVLYGSLGMDVVVYFLLFLLVFDTYLKQDVVNKSSKRETYIEIHRELIARDLS